MAQAPKRDQILEAASKLFMQNGFQAVSMDQIAASVPVSKPTLYSHFKDKRELFAAVVAARCERAMTSIRAEMAKGLEAEESLQNFAHHFLDLLHAKQALQLHRVMVAESEGFPEMAYMFYETGPLKMQDLLKGYLENLHAQGVLNIPDASISADIFLGMIKGRTHLKALLGIDNFSEEERNNLVKTAVSIFMNGQKS